MESRRDCSERFVFFEGLLFLLNLFPPNAVLPQTAAERIYKRAPEVISLRRRALQLVTKLGRRRTIMRASPTKVDVSAPRAVDLMIVFNQFVSDK